MNYELMSSSEAAALLERYPAFTYGALMVLRSSSDPDVRRKMRSIIAARMGDTPSLREILGVDSDSLADFYPDALLPQLSTEDTISEFINRFGTGENQAETDELYAGSAVTPPEMDYIAMLEKEEPAVTDATTDVIDAFLQAVPPPAVKVKKEETPALTESLARIFIKKGNYKKGLEIITELNLKNPKKSIYFADQIRFLKKLIINESKKA